MAQVQTEMHEPNIPFTEQKPEWHQFLDPSAHKIFVWDRKGVYRDCLFLNPIYGHFLGGKKLKGKKNSEVLGKGEAKAVLSKIKHALAFREPVQMEIEWATDSRTFQTIIRFFPILDLVIGVVIDRPDYRARMSPEGLQTVSNGRGQDWQERAPLTEREWRIVEEVKLGKTNKEIAQHLGIAPRTVKFHISNIFEKLHISTREALKDANPLTVPRPGKIMELPQTFIH